jgi:hypothetical protein
MTSLRSGARSDYATPETIGAVLARQATVMADAPALKELTCGGAVGRVWTYKELYADAWRGRSPAVMKRARASPSGRTISRNGC